MLLLNGKGLQIEECKRPVLLQLLTPCNKYYKLADNSHQNPHHYFSLKSLQKQSTEKFKLHLSQIHYVILGLKFNFYYLHILL